MVPPPWLRPTSSPDPCDFTELGNTRTKLGVCRKHRKGLEVEQVISSLLITGNIWTYLLTALTIYTYFFNTKKNIWFTELAELNGHTQETALFFLPLLFFCSVSTTFLVPGWQLGQSHGFSVMSSYHNRCSVLKHGKRSLVYIRTQASISFFPPPAQTTPVVQGGVDLLSHTVSISLPSWVWLIQVQSQEEGGEREGAVLKGWWWVICPPINSVLGLQAGFEGPPPPGGWALHEKFINVSDVLSGWSLVSSHSLFLGSPSTQQALLTSGLLWRQLSPASRRPI